MPRYRVVAYDNVKYCHRLEATDSMDSHWSDIMVNGDLNEYSDPESLVTKTIDVEYETQYMTLAFGVRVVEDS